MRISKWSQSGITIIYTKNFSGPEGVFRVKIDDATIEACDAESRKAAPEDWALLGTEHGAELAAAALDMIFIRDLTSAQAWANGQFADRVDRLRRKGIGEDCVAGYIRAHDASFESVCRKAERYRA